MKQGLVLMMAAVVVVAVSGWSPAAPESPRRGGTLVYGLSVDPPDLEPHINSGASNGTVKMAVYEGLVKYWHGGRIVPALAERWGFVGQTQIVFHLRRDVKFHNGDPVTADDVKFSLERILDPRTGASLRGPLSLIQSVEVMDPLTVKVVLRQPYSPLLAYLAQPYAAIVSRRFVQAGVNLRATMMGTGPFKFVSWEPGRAVKLVRNPDYWQKGLPYLDGIDFIPFADDQTRLTALRAGDIMIMDFTPQEQMNAIQRDPRLRLHADVGIFMCVIFNTSRKPYDNVKLRQAVAYAIDRDAVVKTIFDGRGRPITGDVIPKGWWAFNEALEGKYQYDPERARRLLAEAGYPHGLQITLLAPITYSLHTRTSQVLQAQLAKVGIQVQLELPEWPVVLKRHNEGDYGAQVRGLTAAVNDPDFLSDFYQSDRIYYARQIGFKDEVLDQLLAQARVVNNQTIRKGLYARIGERALELAPWVYIAWGDQGESARTYVKGYTHWPGPLGRYSGYSLVETWLER
ncbi:MAG: ABC transporter substrate-binding protein [Armatimonadota bacterium]|nr:ABC transporter substrate-binding protein [Armatimonadota bacterium]